MNDKQKNVFIGMFIVLFGLTVGFLISVMSSLWAREIDRIIISVSAWVLSVGTYSIGFDHGRKYERAS